MRDVLIAHLDGVGVPIVTPRGSGIDDASEIARRFQTTKRLLERGFLRTDNVKKPRLTFITEGGRAVLAKALADWADALVRAGYLERTDPLINRLLTTPRHSPPIEPEEDRCGVSTT